MPLAYAPVGLLSSLVAVLPVKLQLAVDRPDIVSMALPSHRQGKSLRVGRIVVEAE